MWRATLFKEMEKWKCAHPEQQAIEHKDIIEWLRWYRDTIDPEALINEELQKVSLIYIRSKLSPSQRKQWDKHLGYNIGTEGDV